EGAVAIAVVGVLGEHGLNQLRDRVPVRLVDRDPVHLAQAVANRAHAALVRSFPGHGAEAIGSLRKRITMWCSVRSAFASVSAKLPKDWGDVGRQIGILVGVDIAYELVRGIADSQRADAITHGAQVINFEQSTHT
ncbi:hypothetical protein CG434_23910, partial [Pantoea ananatis]